jgi:uncharacterized membrane protein
MQEVSCSEAPQGGGGDADRHAQQPDETAHLLRSPANAARLKRALEQAERGELLCRGQIEPDAADAGASTN